MDKDFIISWKAAGISLGLLLIIATALVQPLGVSSQFVVTDAWSHTRSRRNLPRETPTWRSTAKRMAGASVTAGCWCSAWSSAAASTAATAALAPTGGGQGLDARHALAKFGPSRAKRYAACFRRRGPAAVRCPPRRRLHQRSHDQRYLAAGMSSFIFGVVTFSVAILTAKFLYRGRA
jgi:hypothetical protein